MISFTGMPDELSIVSKIVLAFNRVDKTAAPFGIYSLDSWRKSAGLSKPYRHQDWHAVLRPILQDNGFVPSPSSLEAGEFDFVGPDVTGTITMLRTSRVKVSKFGATYKLDRAKDYDHRWKELALDRRLKQLARQPSDSKRHLDIVILLSFERSPRHMKQDLPSLTTSCPVHFEFESWIDRYDRGFHNCIAIWAHLR